MSAEDRDAVARGLNDSLLQVMAAAQAQIADGEAAECIRIAELGLQGIQVVLWKPPGPAAPLCPGCRQTDRWVQSVLNGTVRCLCGAAS